MIFLDTASVEDILEAQKLGFIDGVTTNPSILSSMPMDEETLIKKLDNNDIFVFFQVKGDSVDAMHQYFITLTQKINVPFGVKIPITYDGLLLIERIHQSHPDIKILGTVIYTVSQGILASMAGCDYIAPYYNRMLQEGIDARSVLRDIRDFIDTHKLNTKIMAASFKTTDQVVSALLSGAHTCTVPFNLLKQMLVHKSVEHDLSVFNACNYGTHKE